MKLVLKVGGNEVTELSTGSSGHDSSLFEDKNDHDKHKDRKRKKRKKGEKQVPGEEKGRKRRRVKVKWLHCFSFAEGTALWVFQCQPSFVFVSSETLKCLSNLACFEVEQGSVKLNYL